ncbi:unnamed protein product [Strongylus vulgaris]|uniref:Uncharacterized protein n=1 Tax=Strongylus vulgaris TaxID=40348 RepID=A0A3P7ITP2_STRVU|nr:unnamed protein product [Strongylus vulgaris]
MRRTADRWTLRTLESREAKCPRGKATRWADLFVASYQLNSQLMTSNGSGPLTSPPQFNTNMTLARDENGWK